MAVKRRRQASTNEVQEPEPHAHGPHLTRPSRAVEEALRKHIEDTGTPETFHGMILRPLPPGATPEVVLRSYQIKIGKRADGCKAPCAQCSPNAPKYIEGGAIWCSQDGWIRQVGCDCVEKAIGSPEYRQMQERRAALELARDAEDFFLNEWGSLAALLAHVRELRVIAETLSKCMSNIDQGVRGWRSKVREATRGGDGQLTVTRERRVQRDDDGSRIGPRGLGSAGSNIESFTEVLGTLVGRSFLDRTYAPSDAIDSIGVGLPKQGWATAEAAFEASAAMSVESRAALVGAIRKAISAAALERTKLDGARRFLTRGSLQELGRWGADKDASVPFTIHLSADSAEIKHDGRKCRVPLLDNLVVPEFSQDE